MDSNYYHKTKKEILDLPICYRTIEAKEIIALGENHYSLNPSTNRLWNSRRAMTSYLMAYT